MSHRVIDFHDDLGASFSATEVRPPEFLKTASFRETYELQDGDFALIIVDDEGREHRKFACNDAGNTWLSLWYFENVESGLPEYAKVAAAENLATYAGIHEIDMEEMFPRTAELCSELGISPFRQRSWAGDGGRTEKVGGMPPTQSGMFWDSVSRTGVPDPSWLGTANPTQDLGTRRRRQNPMKETLASRPYRLDERRVVVKAASCAPVPSSVKEASAPSMFDKVAEAAQRWEDMSPWERRVVALTLAAEEGDFDGFPAKLAAYMGEEISPNIEDNLRWRAARVARSDEDAENYLRVAAMAKVGSLDLEDAVEAVFLLDEKNGVVVQNGYGPTLPDPYLVVYGGLKKEAMWAWNRGDAYVNEHQLRSYVGTAAAKIQMGELFTDDLIDKFRADPVKAFEALPSEQKKVIARMATSTSGLITGSFRA